MTVSVNALLEEDGAKTALVTTEGFRDVLEIGRQDRPSLYDLNAEKPTPLVPQTPPIRGLRAGDNRRNRTASRRR